MKWFTLTATLVALAFACATASAYEANWTGYSHTNGNNVIDYGYGYGNQLGGRYDLGHGDFGHGCCEPRPHHAFGLWSGFCQPKSCGPTHHGFGLFGSSSCCLPAPKGCGPTFHHRPMVSDCGCGGRDGCDVCRPRRFPVLKSLFHRDCGCGFKLFGWLHGHGHDGGCGCGQGADCGCDSGKMHSGYHDGYHGGEVWSDSDATESRKPTLAPANDGDNGEAIPLPPMGDAPMPLDSPAADGAPDANVPATPGPTGPSALRNIRSLLGL